MNHLYQRTRTRASGSGGSLLTLRPALVVGVPTLLISFAILLAVLLLLLLQALVLGVELTKQCLALTVESRMFRISVCLAARLRLESSAA